jgi:hypothetical protein
MRVDVLAMTTPAPATLEREKDKLYLTDAELFRKLGLPRSVIAPLIPTLETKQAFPRKSDLFGGRRYWPAVKAWLDKYHGINIDPPPQRRERHV